jgi:hypothetical protein
MSMSGNMTGANESLLAGLRALAGTYLAGKLEAEAVRHLGAALGMSDTDLVAAIDGLARSGAVRLSFGGAVEMTEQRPASTGDTFTVNVGDNSVVAVGINATTGNGAIGAGAMVLGQLAATGWGKPGPRRKP